MQRLEKSPFTKMAHDLTQDLLSQLERHLRRRKFAKRDICRTYDVLLDVENRGPIFGANRLKYGSLSQCIGVKRLIINHSSQSENWP